MGSSQQFSLRWNNYLHHITSAFDSLRSDLDLVDVTLSCEGPSWRLGPYGLPSGAPPGAYPASANLLLNPMRGVASAVRPRLYPDGRRRYPCQFCDKTFAHRISVALHMSIHQGKTECHICRKVFSRAYNLKLHIQTVHAERHAERDRPPPPP